MARASKFGELVRKDSNILANEILRVVDYSADVLADFMRLPLSEIEAEAETMRRRWVAKEIIILGMFDAEKKQVGTLFLSVQTRESKRILFVEGCGSQTQQTYERFLPKLEEFARAQNCVALRAETFRAGVFKTLNRLGFQPSKIELIKTL